MKGIDKNENINYWSRCRWFKFSTFYKKGNDITILARNKTYDVLKNKGIVINHKLGKRTIDHFNVIEKLEKDDIYDAIFIILRFSSLDSIVPTIENNAIKNIIFVGNNISAEKYMNIKDKNILFAFFMAAGKKVMAV